MTAPTNEEIAELVRRLNDRFTEETGPMEFAIDADIAAAADALEAIMREREWKPIETAPKDALIDILINGEARWCDCYYDTICDQWRTSRPSGHLVWVPARSVTHWRLPPPSPKEKA